MATPTEILMRSFDLTRPRPVGATVSPRIMPAMAPLAVAPQPAAPVQPELSPTAKYIQDMQALMSGGIGKLSTGEKITALGQVLQAAGSRGAADPAAVLQNVRNQQMEKLNAQLKIAQLQQSAQREQQQRAFVKQYASVLPEAKRGVLENADPAEAFKIVQEETFRPKQVMARMRDAATGLMRLEFMDGSSQLTNRPMPRNTEDRDIGGAIQVIDKDTGDIVATVPKTMAPGEASRLELAERQFAYDKTRPRGGDGGSTPSYRFITTDKGIVAVDPKNPARQVSTGLKAPPSGGYQPAPPPKPVGGKKY